jgi:hypothetical protein
MGAVLFDLPYWQKDECVAFCRFLDLWRGELVKVERHVYLLI